MEALRSRSYVFDPRPNFPFFLAAKRYWTDGVEHDKDSRTLVFAHATGFHKEHWEPTIGDLCKLFREQEHGNVKIREMWSIDAPNHGDAAILNEDTLRWGYEKAFSWEDYGRGIHAFLTGLGTGIDVDFRGHNFVGIGHSMGAIAIMLSTTFQPPLKYSSIQLIEPMLLGRQWNTFGNFLQQGALNRRDIWPSTEEAYRIMKGRPSWRAWDDRVLRVYVDHGLRSLPTLEYPEQTGGVTLKCTRQQEAATFSDYTSRVIAYNLLQYLAKRTPIHFVYGAIDDYTAAEVKDDVLNNGSGGIENLARVVRVSGAGHLVLQTHPTAVAEVIWEGLVNEGHPKLRRGNHRTGTSARL
ncbi:alpha/beta-hydrolase [Leucogyrophana mollusca]|uniref:Alpha/beta-hydrolase n=1 Tax=Leucogyrophana mollusca TaxID=85980 RepID=A0ACB8BJD1_9AGAM|nr:alpha/beta-hydrolase [Leucogyrophana mollusca]